VREQGDPNTSVTAVVGVVSAVLLFVLIVLLQAFFFAQEREETERKVVAVAPEALAQLRAQQQELLHSYRVIDEKRGVVAIPIEVAMALVVTEASRGGNTGSQIPARPR
jgi:hypothetical protein